MAESMSKKEKLARGSAVIKVMKVIPRKGNFLSKYTDVNKLPRKPKAPDAPKGVLADMPWLNLKVAKFELEPKCAKIEPPPMFGDDPSNDPCFVPAPETEDSIKRGLPDGHVFLKLFGYKYWSNSICPTADGNVPEHFNILLGMLMSMAVDPENKSFVDSEAFPCVQFLRTVKTPNGEVPNNIAGLILYIEFICQKMVEEG